MSVEILENYFEEITSPKDLLFNWRKKSWDRFQEIGLQKREALQYVPLQDLSFPPLSEKSLEIAVPAPVVCLPLDVAMRSYGIFLQNRLTQWLAEETDPFAALNGALGKGVFIYVPPKTELSLEIPHLFPVGQTSSPRLHLYVGRGSRVKLMQRAEGAGVGNSFFDAVLDENAELSLIDDQSVLETYFQAIRVKLKRDSRFFYTAISGSAALCRTSLRVQLAEENSEAELRGLTRLSKDRQHHVHALVEHLAPNARSRQHFKSVLEDKSLFSFEGKILVRSAAQKTESYQLSNNLLLSDEARANVKPNLEIFADDVKASHGATVGQLDAEALFYLRSRGLSLQEAKRSLVDGFCREILDRVSHA